MFNAAVFIDNGSVTAFDAVEAEAGTLTDGKLVITSDLGEYYGKPLSLLEDGTMYQNYMGIVFYCEKTNVMESHRAKP